MELWIRSQDKKILTKVDSLILTNTGDIKSGDNIDTGITLASYCPNYQRALEVLDEIQERIVNLQLVSLEEKGKARNDVICHHYLECVYKMPEV